MDFQTVLYNLLLTIITTATPLLVGYAVVFIRQHLSAQQLNTAKVIASNGVVFAQQVSKDLNLNNEAKFNSALASAKSLASKYGVKLSDEQWKNLLEPAYNELKKGLNEVADTNVPSVNSDSIQPSIDVIPTIPEVTENSVTPAITSIEHIPEITPIVDNSPISTIPVVTSTVTDAITAQITLLAQTTANTIITNIVNQTIVEALAKATQI